jgi:hypothetical protein
MPFGRMPGASGRPHPFCRSKSDASPGQRLRSPFRHSSISLFAMHPARSTTANAHVITSLMRRSPSAWATGVAWMRVKMSGLSAASGCSLRPSAGADSCQGSQERTSVHQWATSRPPRPNQRRSQRSSRLIRRGSQETRRASWRGGLDRPEISSRAVACPPELQMPPKWVRQAPDARRFRTKAARSARCAGGICAVAARCPRQYTGRVPGG